MLFEMFYYGIGLDGVGGGNGPAGGRELHCIGWAWDGIAGWHSGWICLFVYLSVWLSF